MARPAALCVDEETLSPSGAGEELPGYGLAGLEERYGFTLPRELVTVVPAGNLYDAVAGGDACDFAIGASTSGGIPANDLTVLEDDLGFFANYNVAVTMRQEVYGPHAEDYETLFTAISEALTNEKLRELNAAVALDSQGRRRSGRGVPPRRRNHLRRSRRQRTVTGMRWTTLFPMP